MANNLFVLKDKSGALKDYSMKPYFREHFGTDLKTTRSSDRQNGKQEKTKQKERIKNAPRKQSSFELFEFIVGS
jgi:hypothetical protein